VQPELVEDLLQQTMLLFTQIPHGLLLEQREDVDHLPGLIDVHSALAGGGIVDQSQVNKRRGPEGKDQGGEVNGRQALSFLRLLRLTSETKALAGSRGSFSRRMAGNLLLVGLAPGAVHAEMPLVRDLYRRASRVFSHTVCNVNAPDADMQAPCGFP